MALPSTKSITNATNATPIVVTSNGHGQSTGGTIAVTGVGGNTAANGTWTVTKVDSNTLSLDGSVGNAAYTSGGSFTAYSASQSTAYPEGSVNIREYTTTTGTGAITLAGAVTGYAPFASIQYDSQVPYRINAVNGSDVATGTFEEGIGTYTLASNTISRDTVTGNDSGTTDPVSFGAGTKIVVANLTDYAAVSVQLSDRTNTGRIQINTAISNTIQEGASPTVYLVPLPDSSGGDTSPGSISLYQMGRRFNGASNAGNRRWVNCAISNPGAARRFPSTPVNGAGDVPFTINGDDGTKIGPQDKVYDGVPADVFAYLPFAAWNQSNASIVMFFMNWLTPSARNDGASKGFRLTVADGIYCLDTNSGSFNSWLSTETDIAKTAYPQRYRYLGTVATVGADGFATNSPGRRMVWNVENRLRYSDVIEDTSTQPAYWDVSRNVWQVMHGNSTTPPWRVYFLAGQSNPVYVDIQVAAYGRVQCRITDQNGDICLKENGREAYGPPSQNDGNLFTGEALVIPRCTSPGSSTPQTMVLSRRQVSQYGWVPGGGEPENQTRRLYQTHAEIVVGDPNIRFAADRPIACRAFMRMEGEA